MKFITDIDKNEFNKFVKDNSKSHFLQTSYWGEFCFKEKNMIPHYVGMKNDKGKLIATALLLQKKLPLNYSYFYCPRGYILDYKDKDLIAAFTKEVKEYVKGKKAIYIKIDPDIKLHNLNLEGNIVEGEDNLELLKFLKMLGYKHLGFNKAFEHNQPRYTFRLCLPKSIDEVISGFHNTTKKIINKGNQFDLIIEKNNEDTIDDFYKTMVDTAKRENISLYSKEYFKSFYKDLHKNNMSDIYTIYLDKKKTTSIIEDKIKSLEKSKEKLTIATKINELDNQIKKQTKLLEEINMIDSEKYPLSSIITAKYGDNVWTIHGGNSTNLRDLNANYLVYFEIIKDAINDGYKMIDFFGTSYNPSTTNPEYGIHLFKKRLGGEYTEFIGEFDYIINKPMYFLFNKLVPIYRKIIKSKRKKEIQNENS